MNSLELNKIFAAILSAGILFSVAGILGDALVQPHVPHEPAIRFGAAPAPAPTQAAAPAPVEPIAPLLASANPANGQTLAQRQCAACHSFNEGGRNAVGPNLWNVVGGPKAHVAGFGYSQALAGRSSEQWGYEELNGFLLNPRNYLPGTRMGYAGMPSAQNRADVIAYLRSLSGSPQPLP